MVGGPQIRNMGTLGGNLCQRNRCWYFRDEHVPCLLKGGDKCFALDGENRITPSSPQGHKCVIVNPSTLAPALIALGARVSLGLEGDSGRSTLAQVLPVAIRLRISANTSRRRTSSSVDGRDPDEGPEERQLRGAPQAVLRLAAGAGGGRLRAEGRQGERGEDRAGPRRADAATSRKRPRRSSRARRSPKRRRRRPARRRPRTRSR